MRSRTEGLIAFDRLRDSAGRNRKFVVPIAIGAGLGVLGLVLVPRLSKAKPSSGRVNVFPNIPQVKGAENVEVYLRKAEQVSGISGLTTFGLAASKRESGWNNMAVNDSPREANAACLAYEYQKTRAIRDSPYNKPEYFCWGTGGWYGQMPAYVVARDPFENLDPIWAVHDPATSTAMFTAIVARMIRDYFQNLPPQHRNWLAIRRSMASLPTFYDYAEEDPRAREVRERFAENLQQIGVSPDFMYEKPSASDYPGNRAVWDALRGISPASAEA